jgi:hypothetical protein
MQHRPAVFAALLGLTCAASTIGDFWVNTAEAVSTIRGVANPTMRSALRRASMSRLVRAATSVARHS